MRKESSKVSLNEEYAQDKKKGRGGSVIVVQKSETPRKKKNADLNK